MTAKTLTNVVQATATQAIMQAFQQAGHDIYVVGGAVRDALLGLEITDVDMATSATPRETLKACKAFKCIPTGIDHGTITVVHEGQSFEITSFRKDVETDGRHAKVLFGGTLTEDAKRRDFTMNALYVDQSGNLHDPLKGLSDAMAQHVRFIGEPEARITEDYLRILRFFRFTALYGQALDTEGYAACAALLEGLSHISKERITSELQKLLSAQDPAPVIASMAQAGILQHILDGSDAKALPILIHLEAEHAPRWQRRLATLLGPTSNPKSDLRLSRENLKEIKTLSQMARDTSLSAFTLGHELGFERGRDALLIRGALLEMSQDTRGLTEGANTPFPLKAEHLPTLSGKALGEAIKVAKALWLKREAQISLDSLIEKAQQT